MEPLASNILVCRVLAQILAPTLGPSGLDVLLPDGIQTNDGVFEQATVFSKV
jgi:chaperonin GroEL (HSP60 family)